MADDQQIVVEQPAPGEIIAPGYTFGTITDQIASVVLTRKTPLFWFAAFGLGGSLLMLFLLAVTILMAKGVGIWGIRTPVMWGFAITNFVWWIGIGHAGTLISAILLLLNQRWRNSIGRRRQPHQAVPESNSERAARQNGWGSSASGNGRSSRSSTVNTTGRTHGSNRRRRGFRCRR